MNNAQQNRRRFERYEMAYPIRLLRPSGEKIAETRTVNLSRGGAMFRLPVEEAPDCGSVVQIVLTVPRGPAKTAELHSEATVVRREGSTGDEVVGVAVQFAEPLPFDLETDAAPVQATT